MALTRIRKSNRHDDVTTDIETLISEQSLDSADFDAILAEKTTDDLTEGDNLYYTNARFDSDFGLKSTDDLSEGSNLYFTDARVDDRLADAEVYLDTTNNGVGLGQAPSSFSGWRVLEIKGGSNGGMLNFEDDSSNRVHAIASAADRLRIQTFTEQAITFETNNQHRMRITSGGNVGIGTASPQVKLDVNGDIYSRAGTVWADTFRPYTTTLSTYGSSSTVHYFNGTGVGIGTNSPSAALHVHDTSFPQLKITDTDDTAEIGFSGNAFYFKRGDNDGSFLFRKANNTDVMALQMSTQRVGINTNNPSKSLHVKGTAQFDSDVTFGGIIAGPATMYIDPAPVDSDAGLLVIRGDLQVDGTTTTVNSTTVTINDKNIVLADSAANASEADGAGITVEGANATIQYDATNDTWDFNKGTHINGYVGIGADNPLVPLHMHKTGTGKQELARMLAFGPGVHGLYLYANDSDNIVYYKSSGSQGGSHAWEAGNTEVMRLTANARLGIGTTDPAKPLTIQNNTPVIRGIDNNLATRYFDIGGENGNVTIDIDPGQAEGISYFTVNIDNTERFRITKDGNVGIGTNAPDAKLLIKQVGGSSNSGLKIVGENGNHRGSLYYNNSQQLILWGSSAPGGNDVATLQFATGGSTMTPRMSITRDGSVGIGTATPRNSSTLDVEGSIIAGIPGNADSNVAALLVNSAGTSSTQAAIAIQQTRAEGDTIIFADYEPYVEWGISADNSADTIEFTGGGSAGNFGSKTFYNRSGDSRTAYIKHRIDLNTGDVRTGGIHRVEGYIQTDKIVDNGSASGLTLGDFNINDSDQWPQVSWLRNTPNNWDEGLMKASSSRSKFNVAHFGIHMHEDRSFAFHSTSWDTEMEIKGDGRTYMKGPVGIGVTNSSSRFEVVEAGANVARFYGGSNAYFDLYETGSSINLRFQNSGESYIGTTTNHKLLFKTNGTDKVTIDTSGRVGIGTSSPTAGVLEVKVPSDGANNGIALMHNGGNGAVAKLYQSSADGYLDLSVGTNPTTVTTRISSYGTSYFNHSAVKVGIGTSSPAQKLHVNGSTLIGDTLFSSGITDGSVGSFGYQLALGGSHNVAPNTGDYIKLLISGVQNDATGTYYTYFEDENDDHVFSVRQARTGTSGAVDVFVDGRVGIGVTNPDGLLQLQSDGVNDSGRMRIKTTGSTGYSEIQFINNTPKDYRLGVGGSSTSQYSNSLYIYDNSTNEKVFGINNASVQVGDHNVTRIPNGSGIDKVYYTQFDHTSASKHAMVLAADNNGEAHLMAVDAAQSTGSNSTGSSYGGWGWDMYYHGTSSEFFRMRMGESGTWTEILTASAQDSRTGQSATANKWRFKNIDVTRDADYKSLQWTWLTDPKHWYSAVTTSTTGNFNVATQFGLPSDVKAIYVNYYYHISGYTLGQAGQGDHATAIWGPVTPANTTSWSFTTSGNYNWGSAHFMHDGDASESGDLAYYGQWYDGSIIPVNANGNIYYRLAHGYSGGTHYNHMYVWGYAT